MPQQHARRCARAAERTHTRRTHSRADTQQGAGEGEAAADPPLPSPRTVVHPEVRLPVPVQLLLPLLAQEVDEAVAPLEVRDAQADLRVCGVGYGMGCDVIVGWRRKML